MCILYRVIKADILVTICAAHSHSKLNCDCHLEDMENLTPLSHLFCLLFCTGSVHQFIEFRESKITLKSSTTMPCLEHRAESSSSSAPCCLQNTALTGLCSKQEICSTSRQIRKAKTGILSLFGISQRSCTILGTTRSPKSSL